MTVDKTTSLEISIALFPITARRKGYKTSKVEEDFLSDPRAGSDLYSWNITPSNC